MYFVRTPWYLKIFPGLTWEISKKNTLFLTFDDGPVPGVTDTILDILQQYNAKATFFCVGENAEKNPVLLQRIIAEGHAIGNHTYHHLSGWRTDIKKYEEDVQQCDDIVHSNLFRPPYGHIGWQQLQYLKKKYAIIMWDVLSGDFDASVSASECAERVIRHAKEGSVIVFHDSEKAKGKVITALPKVLKYFSQKGFTFESIRRAENGSSGLDEFQ